jgi:hypothetical protein
VYEKKDQSLVEEGPGMVLTDALLRDLCVRAGPSGGKRA